MRIAIIHNYMDNIGGAEKLVLTLANELDATIVTTNVDMKNISRMGFNPRIVSIGSVPKRAPYRQQKTSWLFSRFKGDFDHYIIAGDWAVSAAKHNHPNTWYVHSPTRELWDLYKHTRAHLVKPYLRYAYDFWVMYNREMQKKYLSSVNNLVCNSRNTQSRIRRYLKREARVVYPPTYTDKFTKQSYGDFWLSVNRTIPHKRIEIQLKAFARVPNENLIIVGSYERAPQFLKYRNKLIKNLPKNVKMISHVNEDELIKLYCACKGFITTSKDEDFGMTVVEAMAAGKPVVASDEGGHKETVLHGSTGYLVKGDNPKDYVDAIQRVSKNPKQFKSSCIDQSKKFDTSIFVNDMKNIVMKNIR